MIRTTTTLAVVAASLFILSAQAQADTTWETSYRSLGGEVLRAVVRLDQSGRAGTYDTYRYGQRVGGGTVYNVQYQSLGGRATLRGNWSWNGGGSGSFTWTMDQTLDSFQGGYRANSGGGGFWNGQYAGGSGAVGGNGPFKSN